MDKIANILKSKPFLYTLIGINLCLFGVGFILTDPKMMIIAMMSMALCYVGTHQNS